MAHASPGQALAIRFWLFLFSFKMASCNKFELHPTSWVMGTQESEQITYTIGDSTPTSHIGNDNVNLLSNGTSLIVSDDGRFVLQDDFQVLLVKRNASHSSNFLAATSVWNPVDTSSQYGIRDWMSGEKIKAFELADSGKLTFYLKAGNHFESFNHPSGTLLPNQTLETGMRLMSGTFFAFVEHNGVVFRGSKTFLQAWTLQMECNSSQISVSYTGTKLQLSNVCQTFSLLTTKKSKPELPFLRLDQGLGELISYTYEGQGWVEDVRLQIGTREDRQLFYEDSSTEACDVNQYGVCDGNGSCKCVDSRVSEIHCGFFPWYVYLGQALDGTPFLYRDTGGSKEFFQSQENLTTQHTCKNGCLQLNCSDCTAVMFLDKPTYKMTYCFFIPGGEGMNKVFSVEYLRSEKGAFDISILLLIIPVAVVIFWTAAICLLALVGQALKFNPAQEIENLLASTQGLPQRFSYTSLSMATTGFSDKLGSGGYGSVYKGVLNDGRVVAVKRLDSSAGSGTQGAKQFVTEVVGIGGISHVNVVKLCGFCIEATTHCLLVYEFMPNGSLDRWLFGREKHEAYLSWEQRIDVALKTAQGLYYLHEECSEPILHLDVKPQNILLDERFTAKLADFGMAKLLENRDVTQVHTCMRGTPGYMAPEWLTHFTATKKSDVFSYGMVLLEIIGGRKNVDLSRNIDNSQDQDPNNELEVEEDGGWYFPAWAMKQVNKGNIIAVVDEKVRAIASENMQQVKRMVHLALWCIQGNPSTRPPMQTVVHRVTLNSGHHLQQPRLNLGTPFPA